MGLRHDSAPLQARRACQGAWRRLVPSRQRIQHNWSRGPETQPDRSVQKAARPMGTGDRWVASSSDITEFTPEPSMPDVDRSRRGACRTVLGTNHGRTPIAGAVLHGYTSLRQKPLAPLTLAGTKETTKVHLRRRLLYLLCLLRTWASTARWQRSASDSYTLPRGLRSDPTVVSLGLSSSSDEHHLSHSCLGAGMRVGKPKHICHYRAS